MVSSSGRATASQAVGGGFESRILLQNIAVKRSESVCFTAFLFHLASVRKSCYTPISRNARAFNALLGLEYRASAFLLFLLPLTASCVMIKCRKQLRGVTALLGLEYRGKAAFLLAFNSRPCYTLSRGLRPSAPRILGFHVGFAGGLLEVLRQSTSGVYGFCTGTTGGLL